MPRIVRKVQPGMAPGRLDGYEQRIDKVTIQVMTYSSDGFTEAEVETIEEALEVLRTSRDQDQRVWINVIGLHDPVLLGKLQLHFGLHPLAMEDVVNVGQRPKVEFFKDQVFVIMRLLNFRGTSKDHGDRLDLEQFSLFFNDYVVVTLQEEPKDPFEPVRERLRNATGQIRNKKADYLAYALVDALIDALYPILEAYGEWIDRLEQKLIHDVAPEMLETVQGIKRDLLWMRRCAWPHREVAAALERPDQTEFISEDTRPYFRDCYEHTIQLMDVIEAFRDLAGGLTDLYLSSTSNHMNEVMKVLTVIASIFIPLTFIAGIYGMNFNPELSPFNMPELNWAFGYPAAMTMMAAVAIGMILAFRRKKWL